MQHLILLVILILIISLGFLITNWPGGLHKTFSQHAVAGRLSKIFYSLLFFTTLPFLMLFFSAWFVPEKDLPDIFLWFAGIAIIFQIACTLVPEDGGIKTIVHRVLAFISGLAMVPLVAILVTTGHLSIFVRVVALIVLIAMVAILTTAVMNQKGYRHALLLQTVFYVMFFLTILVTTYL